ncbi:MAG: hypothetical protein WD097_01435 [Balneolales bacterium]
MNRAIITADLEESTKCSSAELDMLIDFIKKEIHGPPSEMLIHQAVFYRGDSFQALVRHPADALRTAMILKTGINKFVTNEVEYRRGSKVKYDVAIAIGLGDVTKDLPLEESNEKPFILSGRGLEQLKSSRLTIGVFTGRSDTDRNFETMFYLYEWIMKKWSLSSAELIYHKLKGKTEREIAKELNISQSAANQRSHAACWNGLDRLLKRYKEVVETLYT